MSCRYWSATPARPTMNVRMPLVYAGCVAVIDGMLPPLPLQLFGRPSVASRMIGGEPCGGMFVMKSATTALMPSAVGVLPLFGWLFAVSVAIAFALLSARGAWKPATFKHGVWSPANIVSPKYTDPRVFRANKPSYSAW